jgi:hypothetical protein
MSPSVIESVTDMTADGPPWPNVLFTFAYEGREGHLPIMIWSLVAFLGQCLECTLVVLMVSMVTIHLVQRLLTRCVSERACTHAQLQEQLLGLWGLQVKVKRGEMV